MPDKYCLKGGAESTNLAMSFQIEQLEIALREIDIPFLQNFDLLHNHNYYEQFELCAPIVNFSPTECITILQTHAKYQFLEDDCFIVCKPVILAVPEIHHTMRVYLDTSMFMSPKEDSRLFNSTLRRFKPYGFCFNCFSKDHIGKWCRQESEFGQPTFENNGQENELVKTFNSLDLWIANL